MDENRWMEKLYGIATVKFVVVGPVVVGFELEKLY